MISNNSAFKDSSPSGSATGPMVNSLYCAMHECIK